MSRDLVTPRQRESLADALATCLVSELLAPSQPLWLVSAWISDIDVLDNAGGAFEALAPSWPKGPVKLSTVIESLLVAGGRVVVAMRTHRHNEMFAQKLRQVRTRYPGRLAYDCVPDLHQKCLCGERFALRGSMNFTYNGLNAKEEQMTLSVEPTEVRTLRFELADRWDYLTRQGVAP